MKTNRLTRLASLLEQYEELPAAPAFSLESWSETEIKRRGFLWLQKVACHTHACAVGLACLSETFADDGLKWQIKGDTIIPLYRGLSEWKAVEAFFDLTEAQSARLFDGGDYDGPTHGPAAAKAVAANIRTLIAPKPKRVRRTKRAKQIVEQIKADALAGAK